VKWYKFLALGLMACSHGMLFCQTGSVAGKILDAQTQEPLPFAHVFINNTTLGTTSDTRGGFTLKDVPVGSHEVLFSFMGYQTLQVRAAVSEGTTTTLNVQLIQLPQELTGVEVKDSRDKEWLKQIKRFEKIFLGEKFTSMCKIVNPWVIDFPPADDSKTFEARASAPIEIVNNYLGYTIIFHLKKFFADSQGYTIDGNAYFRELSDPAQAQTWAKNRAYVYSGSDRHFFKSVLDNRVIQEGFRVYVDKPGAVDVNTRSDLFYSEINKKVIESSPGNLVEPASRPFEFAIRLPGRTEIHYLNKTGTVRYYKDMAGTVTWVEVQGDRIRVNNNGLLLNPRQVIYSGEWSNHRIGAMLPLDYTPNPPLPSHTRSTSTDAPLEKVYIHTDKPYYYPGENIWMKAYMSYSQPGLRDSLSQVLYVELINQKKEIILQKAVRIDSAWAACDFRIPPGLPAGNYLLRSYTNWMRNFGDPCFFHKPVPVLNISEKPEGASLSLTATDSTLWITSDKETYRPREKITLTIHTRNENKWPTAANLSVSVTDARQVSAIKEEQNILTGLTLPDLPRPAVFAYPVEQGIMLSGIFRNDKQKPERASLMAVVGRLADLQMVDTDDNGKFVLNGLQFYDSANIAIQARNKRGKPYGRVSLAEREPPAIRAWNSYSALTITDIKSPQRSFAPFELDKDAILLKEVTIKGRRIEEPSTEMQHKLFGLPDHVVRGETLVNSGTTNLAVALQGKVPGMIITSAIGDRGQQTYQIHIRGRSSFVSNTEPLILIDGVPMGGSPPVFTRLPENDEVRMVEMGDTSGDRLAAINIDMIDRVEVTTRTNSLYGEAGRNGVIAVFTKAGANRLPAVQDNETMNVFKIAGYSAPRAFTAPDYNNPAWDKETPDYRSTICWSPILRTDDLNGTCTVSFFAADLPGRYRVVAEGVTESGAPVRAEYFILIVDD
jgi:hypothetical protein